VCDFLNIKSQKKGKRRRRRKIRAIMEGKTVASVALSLFLFFLLQYIYFKEKKISRHFE
jgi:hypothetical protein